MREILQLAIEGIVTAVTRWERVAWSLILAIAIGTLLFLGGCGLASNQLPHVSIDVVPAGAKTPAAPPAPQVIVVPTTASGETSATPQK